MFIGEETTVQFKALDQVHSFSQCLLQISGPGTVPGTRMSTGMAELESSLACRPWSPRDLHYSSGPLALELGVDGSRDLKD